MSHVKTAISIEESLFERAEALAGKLEILCSQLFTRAVERYILDEENEELLRRLNEAHADGPDEKDREALRHLQALYLQMLEREDWEGR